MEKTIKGTVNTSEKIHAIIMELVNHRKLIEVSLDGHPDQWRTKTLEADKLESTWMVAPLEPANGNIRIRNSRVLRLRFGHNHEMFESESRFLGLEERGESKVLRLAMPEVIYKVKQPIQRTQVRIHLPAQTTLSLHVRAKDRPPVRGRLVDLSSGGLSFSCFQMEIPLEVGEQIGMSLGGDKKDLLKGEALPLKGIVRRKLLVRNHDETHRIEEHYGVEFHMLNTSASMTIDRLIHLRLPPAEGAAFITEKMRYA